MTRAGQTFLVGAADGSSLGSPSRPALGSFFASARSATSSCNQGASGVLRCGDIFIYVVTGGCRR